MSYLSRSLSVPFRTLLLLTMALVVLGAAVASGANADTPPAAASATPKTVKIDVATGEITSVEAGLPPKASPTMQPRIGNSTTCLSGRACWYSASAPYANQAFYGAPGAVSGNWPQRGHYETGNYTARGCWRYDGSAACGAVVGPNSYVDLGVVVTGTSFRIY